MTGNNKVWRAPVAGLASVAMLATLGVSAMTANAAEGVASTTFVPATSAATYTVTVNANGGKFADGYASAVESAISGDADKVSLNESKTVATIKNVPATLDNADVTTIFGNRFVSNAHRTLSGFYSGQQAGEGVRVDNPAGITLSGDMTAYAHWYAAGDAATVTFDGVATVAGSNPVPLAPGDKLADWQIPTHLDTNQVVGSWSVNGNVVTTDTAFQAGSTTLTATPLDTVTVTYKNVDSGLGSGATIANGTQYVAAGKAFAPAATATPGDASSNVFIGWYEVKADADAQQVDASELADKPFDFDAGTKTDVTLYAKIGPKDAVTTATVTYYLADDETVKYGTDTVYNNGLTTVNEPPTPTDPTDQGRPFKYWSTVASGAEYDFNTAVPAAGLKLYAVWGAPTVLKPVDVTFDPNYSGSNVIVVKSNTDGTVTAPEVEREGWEFAGWYTGKTNGTKIEDFSDVSKLPTSAVGARNLYAHWTRAGVDEFNKAKTLITDQSIFTEDSYKAYDEAYKAAQKKYTSVNENSSADKIAEATEAYQAAQALLVVKDSNMYTSPVYRVYNKAENKHLYTQDSAEYQRLLIQGWRDEGIAFYAVSYYMTDSDPLITSGLYVKVHRLYDKPAARHLYTTDEAEYQKLVAEGWRDEGTAFYARTQGGAEVYRAYSPSRYEHLFTTNQSEYETATTAQGEGWYRAEGVKFNVEK